MEQDLISAPNSFRKLLEYVKDTDKLYIVDKRISVSECPLMSVGAAVTRTLLDLGRHGCRWLLWGSVARVIPLSETVME